MPRVPSAEQFGNVRVDTGPVLSREFEQGVPSAEAFSGSNLRGQGQLAQSLGRASSVVDKVNHQKRVVANRNTSIRTNAEYNSEIDSLKRELQERTGFEAEGVANEFLEREAVIREKHLKDKNHVVQDNLFGVFEGAKQDGFNKLTSYEHDEFVSDTKVATSLHLNELRDESIKNGGIESIGATLEGMKDTVDGIDFMTDKEKEEFLVKSKSELYEGHFKKLLSDDTFDSTDKATALLLKHRDDIPPKVIASILPTLAGRVIEKEVQFEVTKMAESMSYAQGNDYIEANFDGKKRKAMFTAWGQKTARDNREKAEQTVDLTGDAMKIFEVTDDPHEQEKMLKEWYNQRSAEEKMNLLDSRQFSLMNRMIGMDVGSAQDIAYAKIWNEINNPSSLANKQVEDRDKDAKKYMRPKTMDDVYKELEYFKRSGYIRTEQYDDIIQSRDDGIVARGPKKLSTIERSMVDDFKRNNKYFFGSGDKNNPDGRLREAQLESALLEYSKDSRDLTPEKQAERLNYLLAPVKGRGYKVGDQKIQYRFQQMSRIPNQAQAFEFYETLMGYDIPDYEMPEELRQNILSLSRDELRKVSVGSNFPHRDALSYKEVFSIARRAYLEDENTPEDIREYFNRYTSKDPEFVSYINRLEAQIAEENGTDISQTQSLIDSVDVTPSQGSNYDMLDEVANNPELTMVIMEGVSKGNPLLDIIDAFIPKDELEELSKPITDEERSAIIESSGVTPIEIVEPTP